MDNLAETTSRVASEANREDHHTEVVVQDHVVELIQERIPEMVTASTVGRPTEFLEDLMRAAGADRAAERAAVQVGKMETEPKRNRVAELPVNPVADLLPVVQVVDLPVDQVVDQVA